MKIYKDNCVKDRTVCKNCYNRKGRKNKEIQSLVDMLFQNKRTLNVGPSSSGKIHIMPKYLSRIPNRGIYVITKSPPEHYSNSLSKINKIGEEVESLNEYENAKCYHSFFDILG